MIFRRPTYYDKFKCTADKCSDSCCIGWEIDIDSTTADYYLRVGGAFGERLRNCISSGSFVLGENERCPFLNGRNLCDIYTTLGEEHLCQICSDHPRFYEWFGAIKEGGLGLCCEAAAQLILTEDFALTESVIDEPEEETPTHGKGVIKMGYTEAFEEILGYKFNDIRLLEQALSHSSYANEKKLASGSNERLEFLGDSVLSIVVSDYIYKNLNVPEGELTKLRASLVCEKSLYVFAKQIHLGDFLFLGKGEENTGGRERPSILADAFEAVIAAIYLDGGMEPAAKHIMRFMPKDLHHASKPAFSDFKTVLQEVVQKNPEEKVEYVLIGEEGPDHNKRFVVEVRLNSQVIGKGKGRSKKEAEQLAAKEALELMGYEAR